MNNPMLDMYVRRRMEDERMRDGRNPYGSRGGYVTTRSPRRDRAYSKDYRREYDTRYDYRYDYDDNRRYNDSDYAMGNRGDYGYPSYYGNGAFELRRDGNYYDYSNGQYLDEREMDEWIGRLMQHIDEKDSDMFKRDKIDKKAEELGIKFDRFSEKEFYITVLMLYTDYCKTLGTANIDLYVRLAKDFLDDKDASVSPSEKLTLYHDYIVMGY